MSGAGIIDRQVFGLLKKLAAFFIVITIIGSGLTAGAYSAKSYALVEQSAGRLLTGKNENARLPMASTTKIMTALLAVESGRLDSTVTVSEEAVKVEGSSIGLKAGEKITLRDLVYGLMLESGNDAANAIAISLDGSIAGFADKMNQKAASLGLSNTHFMNPSGLDNAQHYTSALDLARLAAYAMENSEFEKIVSTKKIRITYDGMKNGRTLVNHNRLLNCYEGAIGVKTGFTKKCGRCLVSCAKRDGVCLVSVTLNDPNDWDDHTELLNYGFGLLKGVRLFDLVSPPSVTANVVGGTKDTVAGDYDRDATAGLTEQECSRIKMKINLPQFVYAPVKSGQKLGEIVFTLDGKTAAKTDIRAAAGVAEYRPPEAPNPLLSAWNAVVSFFKNVFGSGRK